MGGEITRAKNRERGPWYEIESVTRTILLKEANGHDASFERRLLKNWSKYKAWENAINRLPPRKSRGTALVRNPNPEA